MELVSWGSNSHGQLGQGHTNDTFRPEKVDTTPLRGCSIKSVVCGGGHTALLTEDSQLFMCGLNDRGQLGDASEERKPVLTFQRVPLPGLVVRKVACGWDFTIVIVSNGQLWGWGSNSYGQIAQDISCKKTHQPMIIESLRDSQFRDASAGLRHAVGLATNNHIWAWGDSRRGQIPESCKGSTSARVFPPVTVTINRRAEEVHCGAFFTVVKVGQDLVGWGENRWGQLVRTPSITGPVLNRASILPTHPVITSVDVGWSHVMATTGRGVVYTWGRGNYGQLGRSTPDHKWDEVPYSVRLPQEVSQVCCGSEFCLAVTVDGRLFTWGWNEHGMCAMPDTMPSLNLPDLVVFEPPKKVVSVAAGAGYAFAFLKPP